MATKTRGQSHEILTPIFYANNKKPSGCFGVASAHASTLLICRKDADKKKDKLKAGLTVGLSGREMFTFDPTMMGHEVSFHFRVFQFLDSSFLIALFASNKDENYSPNMHWIDSNSQLLNFVSSPITTGSHSYPV